MGSKFQVFFLITTLFLLKEAIDSKETENRTQSHILKYKEVVPGRILQIPEDHKPHYGYKTEWWYYTGFLESEIENSSPREFGVQYTLFKIELQPLSGIGRENEPALLVTHVGIVDMKNQSFQSYTDASRIFPGLAEFTIQKDGFRMRKRGSTISSEYSVKKNIHEGKIVNSGAEVLHFIVNETSTILLHGKNGFSQKSEDGTASYYYSIPELEGTASLLWKGQIYKGKIKLWMDREFSSQFLGKNKTGWDWVHLELKDGRRIVAFQVRDLSGQKPYTYSMVWDGMKTMHPNVRFTPTRFYRMKSGRKYPIEWKFRLDQEEFLLQAAVPDCEIGGVLPYWEGPVSVRQEKSSESSNLEGKGYLEMTGYGDSLPNWL